MSQLTSISVTRLAELHDSRPLDVVDVRTPVEFRSVHASMARNVPLDTLDPQSLMSDRHADSTEPVYVICRSGARSTKACEKLLAAGYPQVVNVDGGTDAWEQAGLPVVRGKKAMSLERQVRIVAGFLVLLGALLGFFVHPYFIGLSAFIGAGLMFSGMTDTCGLAMMLAKMPWNRVAPTCSASD